MRVGPPAAVLTFWLSATPSTSSVSSMVPPTFLTMRISRRSTFVLDSVARRLTLSTAMGARMDEYCETICVPNPKVCVSTSVADTDISRLWQLSTHLRVQRRARCAQQALAVIELYGRGELLEELHGLLCGPCKRFRNDGRVDALCQQLLCCSEHASREDDDRCRPVSCLHVLGRREVDELWVRRAKKRTRRRGQQEGRKAGAREEE